MHKITILHLHTGARDLMLPASSLRRRFALGSTFAAALAFSPLLAPRNRRQLKIRPLVIRLLPYGCCAESHLIGRIIAPIHVVIKQHESKATECSRTESMLQQRRSVTGSGGERRSHKHTCDCNHQAVRIRTSL